MLGVEHEGGDGALRWRPSPALVPAAAVPAPEEQAGAGGGQGGAAGGREAEARDVGEEEGEARLVHWEVERGMWEGGGLRRV